MSRKIFYLKKGKNLDIDSLRHRFIKTFAIYKFFCGINLQWKFNNPTVERFWTTMVDAIYFFAAESIYRTDKVHLKLFYIMNAAFKGVSSMKIFYKRISFETLTLKVRSRTPLNSGLKSVWKHFFFFVYDEAR